LVFGYIGYADLAKRATGGEEMLFGPCEFAMSGGFCAGLSAPNANCIIVTVDD
jgi:hypothetical protein